MSIEGRIAVDVSFADTATSSGVQSLKKITLVDTTAYATGKVAIVTGTVGTANVVVQTQPMSPEYKNSAGQVVTFATVNRVAFQSTRDCTATDGDDPKNRVRSLGLAAVTDWQPVGSTIEIDVNFTSGTAAYTLILYGT